MAANNGSIRQSHDERQYAIQAREISPVEMANHTANALTPDRHGLVGHDLRAHPQSVGICWLDEHAKIVRAAGV